MKKCPNCGVELIEDDKFCSNCGIEFATFRAELIVESVDNSAIIEPKNSKKKINFTKVTIALLGLSVLAWVGSFALVMNKPAISVESEMKDTSKQIKELDREIAKTKEKNDVITQEELAKLDQETADYHKKIAAFSSMEKAYIKLSASPLYHDLVKNNRVYENRESDPKAYAYWIGASEEELLNVLKDVGLYNEG